MCPKRSLYSWSLQRGTRLSLCPHSCKGQSAQSLRRELSLLCCLHSINAEGRKEGGREKLRSWGLGGRSLCQCLLCGLCHKVFMENGDPQFPGNNMHGAVSGQDSPTREACASLHLLPGYLCVCVWGGVLAEGICSTVTYLDTCMKNKFPLKSWEPQ